MLPAPSGDERLERFACRGPSHARLTGVSLAVHAIPDAFLILHTGVGCKYKGAAQIRLHDLARPSHHGEGYTEVSDAALIKGSAQRLGAYMRSWYARRRPSFMAVTASTFLEMAGEDFAGAVARAASSIPCPAAYVPCLGFSGDLYAGYAELVRVVLRRIPFARTRPARRRVSVLGYLFDRYELDHSENLRQLGVLLGGIGLEAGPALLSGRPYAELQEAASSAALVALPYARDLIPEARRLTRRPVAATDLPVGIRGTQRWLRAVAATAGAGTALVESFLRGQLSEIEPQVDMFRAFVRENFRDGRTAVFADTPLAAGLTAALCELGLPPVLVGLRDTSLGGRRAFVAAARRAGAELRPDLVVLEAPSLTAAREGVIRARERFQLAAVIGSAAELRELALAGVGAGGACALLELGFPSVSFHALYPAPVFGFGGVLHLSHRLMNGILSPGESRIQASSNRKPTLR
jgi:nitrogenase molybdenum-iron protein alpha/beta subunit